ncbi:hypothetical protein RISK_003863 [Rhodopirellula islandica]|uniref:Uncharacterized protein n=1 Tax=Rhodopirellula islandica TaxID=595434 RepID=A0A0J1BCE3_RHOIS|nr:hypothetical protein RISK_003863 [Rhodopirellula islandica]
MNLNSSEGYQSSVTFSLTADAGCKNLPEPHRHVGLKGHRAHARVATERTAQAKKIARCETHRAIKS